jgi:putative FmdB family regulatory protein
MPTYEYACGTCGTTFEKIQSILSNPVADCPSCENEAKRLFTPRVNFIFKGPGFYATEYRSEDYKKKMKEEREEIEKKDREKEPKAK